MCVQGTLIRCCRVVAGPVRPLGRSLASCDARSWLWVDRTPRLPTSTLLHRLRVATSAPTDG